MRVNPAAWGVQRRYRGSDKRWRTVSEASVASVLGALGADTRAPRERLGAPLVIIAGDTHLVGRDAVVELEDGREAAADGRLPADLPLGYHRLHESGRDRL